MENLLEMYDSDRWQPPSESATDYQVSEVETATANFESIQDPEKQIRAIEMMRARLDLLEEAVIVKLSADTAGTGEDQSH